MCTGTPAARLVVSVVGKWGRPLLIISISMETKGTTVAFSGRSMDPLRSVASNLKGKKGFCVICERMQKTFCNTGP